MASGIAILLLLTVVPLVLIRLSAALPLDLSALSPEGLVSPDDGALLLLLLVSIAWVSWTVLAGSVAVELVAALRGVPTPRIPGLGVPQRCAGVLVTALLVGTIPVGASAGEPALGSMDLAAAVRSAQADIDGLVQQLDGRAAASSSSADRSVQSEEPQSAELPTIVTQRHDTLWLLAEQHLGSGERFDEIVELNRGVRQPDGRALADEGRLYPGWVLRLPANADLQAPRPDRVVVERGDTLWAIADEQLQDPTRFRELADANRGDLQPDGKRLRDADLILPGWVIAVPTSAQPRDHHDEADASAAASQGAPASPVGDGAAAAEALDGRGATGSMTAPKAGVEAGPTHAPEAGSEAGSETGPTPGGTEPAEAVESAPDESAVGGSARGHGVDPEPRPGGSASPQSDESAPDEQSAAGGSARGLEAPGSPGSTASAPATGRPGESDAQRGANGAAPPTASAKAETTPDTGPTPSEAAAGTAPDVPASGAAAQSGSRAPGSDVATGSGSDMPGPDVATESGSEVPASVAAAAPASPAAVPSPAPPRSTADPMTASEQSDEGAGNGDSQDDPVTASGEGAGFALPAGGVAAALLLAALGLELARRRVQFQRWRRPGEQLPVPSARACRLETSLLKGQTARDSELLAAALGALALAPTPAPVRVVELAANCVVVHLGEDWGRAEAPDPFRVVAPGVLRATRDDLRACASDAPASSDGSALVTVGTRGEWTVLVDLETVGTLRVAGDDEIVGEVLRAIGVEVALDARHRGSTRTLCLLDPRVAEAAETGEVIVDSDPDRVGRAVATALRRARGMKVSTSSTSIDLAPAEPASGAASAGLPAQHSSGDGLSSDDVAAAAERGHSGVAVLETSPVIDLRAGGEERSPAGGLGASSDGSDGGRRGSGLEPGMPDSDGVRGDRSGALWDEWSDPFEIVVADRPIGVEVPPRSGVGLVTSAAATGVRGITLSVLDPGRAVLVEDGVELVPVGLTSSTVDDLVELFSATEVPGKPADDHGTPAGAEAPDPSAGRAESAPERDEVDGSQVNGPARSGVMAEPPVPAARTVSPGPTVASGPTVSPGPTVASGPTVSPRPTDPPEGAASAHPSADASGAAGGTDEKDTGDHAAVGGNPPPVPSETTRHATAQAPADPNASRSPEPAGPRVPRLLLLGDVEVEHAQGRAESTRLGRLAETAAFVLLHPDARPSELLAALWPGRNANPQSCRQMISRTRSWLGRTDDGEPYLEPFAQTNGRLRLRPEVRSDWDDFRELADRGMADPQDIDNLTAALELVRGRPFGSLWRRELAWADLDSHRMISRIVDVGYELALRHEAAGRTREARAAVHRALRTQVESELLDELLERLGSG